MSVTKKIEEILSPADLKSFEEGVDKMVTARVEAGVAERVAIIETELKQKYDTISEQYVEKKIASELVKKSAELVTEADAKISALEKKVVSRLGSFLDRVVTESISDSILEKVAINEVALPMIEKIRSVFSEGFVQIDSDSQKVIDEAVAKSVKSEKQLSESISKNMVLEERLEKLAVFLMISERTQGLTPALKKQVVEEFKSRAFDEVDGKIDGFVTLIKEAATAPKVSAKIEESVSATVPVKKVTARKRIDEMTSVNDTIAPVKPIMEKEESAYSILDAASSYMDM
jgi:hypothetical protein